MDGAVSTEAGIPLAVSYGPDDLPRDPSRIPPPGEFPFTRGNFPGGYRDRLWTFRQYSGFGTAEESNERYRYLLEQGGTGLSVALDLPTQMRLRLRRPRRRGGGRPGRRRARHARRRRDPVRRASRSTASARSFTINGTAAILLAFYVAVGEKQGVAAREAARHDPERHPQGVRRARHLDLAADAVAAADRRHDRVLRGRGAALQRDLGRGRALPRRRRQRGAGDGVHAADGVTYCDEVVDRGPDDDRRVRAAGLVLLLHARRLLRGDRQVPRRTAALGARSCGSATAPQDDELVHVPLRRASAAARRCTRRRRRTTSCGWPTRRWPSVLGGVQSMFTAAWDEPFALPTEESHDARAAHAADPRPRDRRRRASSTRSAARTSSRR